MTRPMLRLPVMAVLAIATACAPPPPPYVAPVWGGAGSRAPVRQHRPPLPNGADTNSAEAYAAYGRFWLARAPDSAAAAFEWALRLDPEYAHAYDGRASALLLAYAEPNPLGIPAWRFRTPVPIERLRYVDSLQYQALLHDPFLDPQFEYLLTGVNWLPDFRKIRDPALAGYVAYRANAFEDASRLLAQALAKSPRDPMLRSLRARAEYHLGRGDSVAAELNRLLTTLDEIDSARTVLIYRSREVVYYALGAVETARRDTAAARVAYEHALVENLSLYMAHARLAGLALQRGDTAAALTELAAGDEMGASDPVYQYYHGLTLYAARRPRDAAAHLLRAVDLAPYFAKPYYYLARLYDENGHPERALEAYEGYVMTAPQVTKELDDVRRRVAALRARVDSTAARTSP